jgi:hypothetical protein
MYMNAHAVIPLMGLSEAKLAVLLPARWMRASQ